jgi:hypothetical protein
MNHVLVVFHGTLETYVLHPIPKSQVEYEPNPLWIFLHAVWFFFSDKLGALLLWTPPLFRFHPTSYHDQNVGALVGR